MRIRTVKPEFWDDETICGLSRDARLLFIATFNVADDEGILRWTAEKLKAVAFLYDEDVSLTRVAALMHELVTARLISPYTHRGSLLAWIVNFHKHQRVNRPQPSKFPAPSLQKAETALMYAERDHWMCHLCDGPVNRRPYYNTDPYSPTQPVDTSSLNASLDHLVPRSKGGTDFPSNIRLAHVGCNKGRSNRDVDTFTRPASVARALEALTSDDAATVTVPDFFTEGSVNDPAALPDHSPPEVEVGSGKGSGSKNSPAPAPPRAAPIKKLDHTNDPDFLAFWKIYPRKDDKADAYKAWKQALRAASVEVIVEGATRYAADPALEPRYTKMPATWLRAGSWENGLIPISAGQSSGPESPEERRVREAKERRMAREAS